MTRSAGFAALLSALVAAPSFGVANNTLYTVLGFEELRGWSNDDHAAALDVFKETCPDMDEPAWLSLCALATNQRNAHDLLP